MSTPVRYAELEIGISAGPPAAAGQPPRYRVELRFDDPEDAAARPPVVGEASIDAEKLLALHDSSLEYGRALSSSLFATEEIEKPPRLFMIRYRNFVIPLKPEGTVNATV